MLLSRDDAPRVVPAIRALPRLDPYHVVMGCTVMASIAMASMLMVSMETGFGRMAGRIVWTVPYVVMTKML